MSHEVFVLFTDIEKDSLEAIGEDLTEFESGDFGKWSHFFLIVERLCDGGVFAAERAIGIASNFDFAKGRGEGPVVNETAEGRFSKFGQELDRFHGLEASYDSREHAQDTGFGSCRDGTFGRSLGKEAAVAGAAEVRGEDGDLAFELEDGAVNEWLLEEVGRVVGGEAGGEIIGAIEDGVVGSEKVEAVFGLETAGKRNDFNVWVDLEEARAGAFEFGGADAIGVVKDLTMKI